MPVPELLAPAGNLEKLETALLYGADAVYCGLEDFSLRARAGNLSLVELERACRMAHSHGKRLYLTLNAYLRPGEEPACRELLSALRSYDHDACIIADPGMLVLLREIDPAREVHLSTQANTTSAAAAQFWQSQQVKRLNPARELTLAEIRAMRAAVDLELEVFVHGAMCVAYSGRCLLSSALTARSANRGDCSQPCRWEYVLQEPTRPGLEMPAVEDERGTYLFNSRDLCLIEHLPALIAAGIDSLKIEGRMKSRYYVAAVTRVYRDALDAYRDDPQGFRFNPDWVRELEAVSHRPYGPGFLFGGETAFVAATDGGYRQSCDFLGVVLEIDEASGRGRVQGRNRFAAREELELIGPGMRRAAFRAEALSAADGRPLTVVQPNAEAWLALPAGSRPGDLLRRWR